MQGVHTVQASVFERLIEELTVVGIDPDTLLRELAIDRRLIDDPEARIPFRKYAAMLEAAAERSGDDCFGLHLGAKAKLRRWRLRSGSSVSRRHVYVLVRTRARDQPRPEAGGDL